MDKTHTRFYYAALATMLTFIVLMWGSLSPGGEVAAFGFLSLVAGAFGVTKYAEHRKSE